MPAGANSHLPAAPKKQFRIEKLLKTPAATTNGGGEGVALDAKASLLLQRVEALHEKIDTMGGAGAVGVGRSEEDDVEIRVEITRLVKEIGKTKAELASLRHPMAEEDEDRIVTATSELDAIVEATEVATDEILRSSEEINEILERLRGDADVDEEHRAAFDQIEARTIAILEACNFQDITGQRINKVVKTMQFIEERVKAMIDIWGVDAFAHLPLPEVEHIDEDAALLEGPQLENGLTQDDIDAMFD